MASVLPPPATTTTTMSTVTTPFLSPSSPLNFHKKASRNPKLIFTPSLCIVSLLLLCYSINNYGRGGGGGTTTTMTTPANPLGKAAGGPISVADLRTCGPAIFMDEGVESLDCCPPIIPNTTVVVAADFTNRPPPPVIRVRRPAHLVDDEYVAKYSRAVQLMRELPDDDPRSFMQQYNVHCAYCNGAHRHLGFPESHIDVHFSWLFLPFHRYYLYFHERILGKLIGDPTFALPYWNWDSPVGMQIPQIFADPNSPLYSANRDPKHIPPAILDLNYDNFTDNTEFNDQEMIHSNLAQIYRTVVSGAATTQLFLGSPYRAGDEPNPGMGSTELIPHGTIHFWVGDRTQPNHEDMGALYSSARDPMFYSHHSNMDRIWTIWKNIPGGKRTDFTDPDWLNTEFVFYDEEAHLVKVKIKDCLDTRKLGYIYEDADIPWLNARPTPRVSTTKKKKKTNTVLGANVFPLKLNKVVRVPVVRSRRSLSSSSTEVLVVEGIEVEGKYEFVKFDVIVNDGGDEAGIGPRNTEFAGSFVDMPSLHKHYGKKMSLRLGISELLEDLGAENDDSVVVTLVPRYDHSGIGVHPSVTVGGIKIEYQDY